MNGILGFIANYFNTNVLFLFLVSSAFLLLSDRKQYKKDKLKREYRMATFFGYFYIAFGIIVFAIARLIRL